MWKYFTKFVIVFLINTCCIDEHRNVLNGSVSSEAYQIIILPVSLSVRFSSDEDEALYEKVSGEQWRVQCLVQLFGEMKDSDLPGEFFLLLLQVLAPWFPMQLNICNCCSKL